MRIALDVDGVQLDYNQQFAQVAARALGRVFTLVDPLAHHFVNAYGTTLTREEKATVYAAFDQDGWLTMPAIAGAVDATQRLHQAGHRLTCVSSMPPRFAQHRAQNLANLGIPVDEVIGSDRDESRLGHNPKAAHLIALAPHVFVDDQLRNFEGLPDSITTVWIDRGAPDGPNQGADPTLADFTFPSLAAFADALLAHPALFDHSRSDTLAPPAARSEQDDTASTLAAARPAAPVALPTASLHRRSRPG